MSARKPIPPRPVARVQIASVDDPNTSLALDTLASAVQGLQEIERRVSVSFDLVVGTNKIAHGLGRPCKGYTITPTTADATFAHAIDNTNTRKDLEVWITVVGVSQNDAIVEIY